MKFHTLYAYYNSTPEIDIFIASHDVKRALRESGVKNGLLTTHLPAQAAALVLVENDPEIQHSLKEMIQSFVAGKGGERPIRRSGTGRSEAHLRAALLNSSLCIPIKEGKLLLGPWQEVVVYDFDDRRSRRELIIHIMGDGDEEKKK